MKVLDFGLATAIARPELTDAEAPTMELMSQAGMIVGTAAYMSPEQARGLPVDKRTDIWAFGCVLYEMLTGKQLFAGQTMTDVMVNVLEREPDWSVLPGATPATVRRWGVRADNEGSVSAADWAQFSVLSPGRRHFL